MVPGVPPLNRPGPARLGVGLEIPGAFSSGILVGNFDMEPSPLELVPDATFVPDAKFVLIPLELPADPALEGLLALASFRVLAGTVAGIMLFGKPLALLIGSADGMLIGGNANPVESDI